MAGGKKLANPSRFALSCDILRFDAGDAIFYGLTREIRYFYGLARYVLRLYKPYGLPRSPKRPVKPATVGFEAGDAMV
jgi:hypothetical protein